MKIQNTKSKTYQSPLCSLQLYSMQEKEKSGGLCDGVKLITLYPVLIVLLKYY